LVLIVTLPMSTSGVTLVMASWALPPFLGSMIPIAPLQRPLCPVIVQSTRPSPAGIARASMNVAGPSTRLPK
jgi:hypothetical protein